MNNANSLNSAPLPFMRQSWEAAPVIALSPRSFDSVAVVGLLTPGSSAARQRQAAQLNAEALLGNVSPGDVQISPMRSWGALPSPPRSGSGNPQRPRVFSFEQVTTDRVTTTRRLVFAQPQDPQPAVPNFPIDPSSPALRSSPHFFANMPPVPTGVLPNVSSSGVDYNALVLQTLVQSGLFSAQEAFLTAVGAANLGRTLGHAFGNSPIETYNIGFERRNAVAAPPSLDAAALPMLPSAPHLPASLPVPDAAPAAPRRQAARRVRATRPRAAQPRTGEVAAAAAMWSCCFCAYERKKTSGRTIRNHFVECYREHRGIDASESRARVFKKIHAEQKAGTLETGRRSWVRSAPRPAGELQDDERWDCDHCTQQYRSTSVRSIDRHLLEAHGVQHARPIQNA